MDDYKYVVTVGAKFIEELVQGLVDRGYDPDDFRIVYLESGRAELWCPKDWQ